MEEEFTYLCKATYLYLANDKWPRNIMMFPSLQAFEEWCEKYPMQAKKVNSGDLSPLFR